MRNDDLLRLKQMRGAPPELVRALEALRKGANETARLERVASKLGPLLDAPPNASPSAGGTPLIASAIKLLVGGLVLLVPALFILRSERSEKPQVAVLAKQSAKLATPAPETTLEPVAALRREPAPPPRAVATEQAASAAPVDHAYHDKARAAQSARAHAHPPLPAARPTATATAISTADAPAPNPVPAAAEIAQASQPSPQNANAPGSELRAASVQQPKAASVATPNPVVRSEAELLFEARRAMPSDAARALRLLGEHEKRYPNGRLVPEREVLAIEALRSLGRKAEADARLRRFEARYPDSFHLQRLQH
jgi:hypothetical protein